MASKETRLKLSKKAKISYEKNENFKNQAYEKTCDSCNDTFTAKVINSKYCTLCKMYGYYRACENCGDTFRTKYAKYCSVECKTVGTLRNTPDDIGNRIKNGKTKSGWTTSIEGQKFYNMLGVKNSKSLKKYFKTPAGKKQIERVKKIQSKIMKDKISSGEWTPNITNSWTHWTAVVEHGGFCKKFRSSWEACFWLSNTHLEYETYRVSSNGRVYIADFYDRENNILYEIKPKSHYRKSQDKMDAFVRDCIKNNIKFIWVNENNIFDYIDETVFVGDNMVQLIKLKEGVYGKNWDTENI